MLSTSRKALPARFGGSERRLVLLALVIGVGAGLGAIAFRYMIEGFTWLSTGHLVLGPGPHVASPLLPGAGVACLLLAPVVGGLLYGPLVSRFAPEARGHGVPEVMLAVSRHRGRIRPRVAFVKSVASAICIGAGGSVGREGPIVQIGSALGSTIGQIARMPPRRVRLLVACGAAGGIAATFNAPIAGVFFALEVILRDFTADAFAVVVLSSVTAAAIGRAAFGSAAFLQMPHFQLESGTEYVLFAGLGVLAALVAILFVRVLYGSEDIVDRIWKGPDWLRPAAGGLLLGGLLLVLPQMYGVGYPVLEAAVRGHYLLVFLVVLMLAKIVATSLTIAIGGSGGVFAPSLFIGAMLGAGYGQALQGLVPGAVGSPGAYGLVGMAAVFAAAARAPITAVLIIFELTGDYPIILPLMVAVGVAAGVAGLLTRDSIYTLKLRRRGIDVNRPASGVMQRVMAREAMQPVSASVPADAPVTQVVELFSGPTQSTLPVLAAEGRLLGVISVEDLELSLAEDDEPARVTDLAREVPPLHADDSLDAAIQALTESEDDGLPVLEPASADVVGWITHADILAAYQRALRPSPVDRRSQASARVRTRGGHSERLGRRGAGSHPRPK